MIDLIFLDHHPACASSRQQFRKEGSFEAEQLGAGRDAHGDSCDAQELS
jgi:hypothetical protein